MQYLNPILAAKSVELGMVTLHNDLGCSLQSLARIFLGFNLIGAYSLAPLTPTSSSIKISCSIFLLSEGRYSSIALLEKAISPILNISPSLAFLFSAVCLITYGA